MSAHSLLGGADPTFCLETFVGTKRKTKRLPRLNKTDVAKAKKFFLDELHDGVLGPSPTYLATNSYIKAVNSLYYACVEAVTRVAGAL